jgi:hypothetical protein
MMRLAVVLLVVALLAAPETLSAHHRHGLSRAGSGVQNPTVGSC